MEHILSHNPIHPDMVTAIVGSGVAANLLMLYERGG